MISDPSERLRRVLELEQRHGFPDTAVVGGVDRMLRLLHDNGSLPPGTPAHEALTMLPARGYGSMSPEERSRWARRVLSEPTSEDPFAGRRLRKGNTGITPPEPVPPSPIRNDPTDLNLHQTNPPPVRAGLRPPPSPTPAVQRPPAATPARLLPRREAAPVATALTPAPAPRKETKPHKDGVNAPVTALPGVSTVTATKLAKLGITAIRDLLWHLPHRYDDFSKIRPVAELAPGEEQTVVGTVWSAGEAMVGRFKKASEAVIGDHTGNLRVVWFNQPWVAKQLRTNMRVALSGKVSIFQGVRQMESPEWESLEGDLSEAVHTGRMLPVYPLTAGLSGRTLRRLVRLALDTYLSLVEDPLPDSIREANGLLPLTEALRQMHYPEHADAARAARDRLAFDELLTLQLAVVRRRLERTGDSVAPALPTPDQEIAAFHSSLPFGLTGAQHRVCATILADLAGERPMSRLVQGDVGSGKTVVAATAIVAAVTAGHQAALMAPTEILAEQHFRTLTRLFGGEPDDDVFIEAFPKWLDRPLRLALLRGGLGAKAKAKAQQAITSGLVDVAIGTQALIQQDITIPRLSLAIVDEQHRFGVAQRAALRGSHSAAHLLVMTATPIPRTLALTLYGDLDVSTIDEMPPGRMPVKTLVVQSHERDAAYNFIIEQLRADRQAFVICPLVEESEKLEVRAATVEFERLQDVFTSASLALLHGRMPPAKKDAMMREFRDHLHDLLVSTAVVEVGIDVPNATVIMIEGADRFGLAQLHQFRGRVGRGEHQSFCFLMADGVSEAARERLQLMEDISDGFKLAEEDLRLRGPGDYFGTRQSGLPQLKVAGMADTRLLERAREVALAELTEATDLATSTLSAYAAQVDRLLNNAGGDVS